MKERSAATSTELLPANPTQRFPGTRHADASIRPSSLLLDDSSASAHRSSLLTDDSGLRPSSADHASALHRLSPKDVAMSFIRSAISWLPVFAFVLIMMAMMFLVSSCTVIKESYEPGVLRMNLGNEPPSLDWHVTTDFTSFDVISNIMIGLTQFNPDLSCAPAVAERWEVLDGGTRYLFHLRDPLKTLWSDGQPVTARDFEYAWKRLALPETGGAYANFLYDIVNGIEINKGKLKDVEQLGVKALDDRTLEVRLKKPAAYFIYLTSHPSLYPMRKDMIEKFGDRWTEPGNIITNGPFLLKKWQHEYKIELAGNPQFFEGAPKLQAIKMFMIPELSTAFSLFENDELDYVDNRSFSTSDVERYRKSPNYRNIPILSGTYLGFNVTKPPMTDPRVRKAIALSIDKSMFPKILRRAERPIGGWIPPGLSGYSADSGLKYDPAKGRELLAEAGYPGGKGFPRVEMLYPNREDTRLIVEAVQANLKKDLGIHIELMNQEWKVYLATKRRDAPPLFRASWGADFPDSESFMNLFTSTNDNNCTKWSDKKYDDMIASASGEIDPVKRANIYREADRMLCQEGVPLVPTYLITQNVLTKPWTHNLLFTALDIQYFKGASVGDEPGPSYAPIESAPPPAPPGLGPKRKTTPALGMTPPPAQPATNVPPANMTTSTQPSIGKNISAAGQASARQPEESRS